MSAALSVGDGIGPNRVMPNFVLEPTSLPVEKN